MRTFYTARDIEDMAASGDTTLEIDESVVVTDEAREKARKLGLEIKMVSKKIAADQEGSIHRKEESQKGKVHDGEESDPDGKIGQLDPKLISRIKSTVIAQLGNNSSSDILDKIIPEVLARFSD
ncbi:MAG: hypothetical protein JRI22_23310 [Deltaproteobacteria bacterium]|nr:hypothetical protein [Deltaproteobacteria bacterium]